MDSSVERMLQYCTGIANEFEARVNRVRAFVPNHNPTAGAANEIILRDFLANLITARYKVSQGFICDPTASERTSKQCDILVYDHHQYPLVYSEGGIQIVFPQAVKMLIEVKTGLDDLASAFDNIRVAKEMNYLLNGVIFAFQSPREETVIKNYLACLKDVPRRFWPMAVLLLD